MLKACKLPLTVEANKAGGIKQEAVCKEAERPGRLMLWNSCCESVDVKINPASFSATLPEFKSTMSRRVFLSYTIRSLMITVTQHYLRRTASQHTVRLSL